MEEEKRDFTEIIEEKRESAEELVEDKQGEAQLIEERKEKLVGFLKKKKDWIFYLVLALIVWLGVFIRTRNIDKLKDVTTGSWILGPDLDPFLFLRWAKHIVENGSLMTVDYMRYVPLGHNTAGEMKLLAYMIAWFHNFLSTFSMTDSVTYSAIVFPVFMFGLTAIAFFLFARKIFYKEKKLIRNLIALIATLFFVLIPALLSRTIAGIPEKESAAFFFMFISLYFFLEAFTAKKFRNGLIFGVVAGIFTGLMGLIWGGVHFVFFTISPTIFLCFILGKIKSKGFAIYSSWLVITFLIMSFFSTRYPLKNLILNLSTGSVIAVFLIIGISLLFMKMNFGFFESIRKKSKLPKELFFAIVSIVLLGIVASIILGPGFLWENFQSAKDTLIEPSESRFSFTVAENKQPYYATDWKNSFGPVYFGIPFFFWLFFIGAVLMFFHLMKNLSKKHRVFLTFGYVLFLISIIFSRYAPGSSLDGKSGLSLLVYFGGWLLFLVIFIYVYREKYLQGDFYDFRKLNFAYILYFSVLTLAIIGARGAIRLIMVLGALAPVAAAFLSVKVPQKFFKEKEEAGKIIWGIIAIIVVLASLFTIFTYYKIEKAQAENFAPGMYQMQWQKAMAWVRDSTPTDSVFAHWWDYGYWLQSIGERATILDGGNAIVYWNHLLGRHVLTGPDEMKALEFLYAHNGTHLLIDSTEIGKYTAYSSIGADENYDRFSWIPTFLMDEKKTTETKDEMIYFYPGGTVNDEDIVWNDGEKDIFLPKKAAAIGGFIVRVKGEEIMQPLAIFVYQGNQYEIPLKYAYDKDKLYEFNSGLDAGIFLYPRVNEISGGQVTINERGALLYLSSRTVNSQVAQLFLFGQESNYFKLAHTESNLLINSLREQGLPIGEFLQYQGFQGPIKIWEVNYPANMRINPEFLKTEFPDLDLYFAEPGEYN